MGYDFEVLCMDCPPRGYPTDETRCNECPRRKHQRTAEANLTTRSDGDLVCLRHAASEQLRIAADQLQAIYAEQRRRLAADDETNNQENV